MGCAFSEPYGSDEDHNANQRFQDRLSLIRGNKTADGLWEANLLADGKVVLLGDSGVGKSSVALRFCHGKFSPHHEVTIGAAFMQRSVQLRNGKSMKLQIWDTGGQERFRAMAPLYYRDAAGALVVWDCTQSETFDSVKYWCAELKEKAPFLCCIATVGNKADALKHDVHMLAQATANNAISDVMPADTNTTTDEFSRYSTDTTTTGSPVPTDTPPVSADTPPVSTDIPLADVPDSPSHKLKGSGMAKQRRQLNAADRDAIARRYQTMQESKAYCDAENILFVQCSAKTGSNVDVVFEELANMIHERRRVHYTVSR